MGPRPDRAGEISPAPSHAVRARTLQICAQNQLDTRFLPVLRAGNAPSPARSSRPTAVHPRACGERAAWRARKSPPVGSSPRLRGTLQRLGELDRLARFIPAPAGNARAARRRAILPSVHPRACGERRAVGGGLRRRAHIGSSPRLRGTPERSANFLDLMRFIPAPAGNARPSASAAPWSTVHPRACGERWDEALIETIARGSSPRLRGTRGRRRAVRRRIRFIPAPAGNAVAQVELHSLRPVHPRACGERSTASRIIARHTGSSPRLRGTRTAARREHRGPRFIPAPAGNALGRRAVARSRAVHPRACGERGVALGLALGLAGSSPRLRGTHRKPFRL